MKMPAPKWVHGQSHLRMKVTHSTDINYMHVICHVLSQKSYSKVGRGREKLKLQLFHLECFSSSSQFLRNQFFASEKMPVIV